MALLLLTGACASSPAKIVTEVKYVKMNPPAALMACPVPKVEQCADSQDCIANSLVSVSAAWAECHDNAVALRKWAKD